MVISNKFICRHLTPTKVIIISVTKLTKKI